LSMDEHEDQRHAELPHGASLEDHSQPQMNRWWVGGWLAPMLVTAFTLGWLLFIYYMVPEIPSNWKYHVVPYVPGQSVISTEQPKNNDRPQVELPTAIPGGSNARP
jgi:hypothetical protein